MHVPPNNPKEDFGLLLVMIASVLFATCGIFLFEDGIREFGKSVVIWFEDNKGDLAIWGLIITPIIYFIGSKLMFSGVRKQNL